MFQMFQNNLLTQLSTRDQALLEPDLEEVQLPTETVLEVADTPLDHAYFPTSGVASTVTHGSSGRRIEVGLFGREGMSSTVLLHHDDKSPLEVFMQVPGHGLRIKSDALQDAIGASPSLHRHLLRYAQAHHIQVTQTAISNGYGRLEERLARWILMCDDRMDGNSLTLTHKFLSKMLGVRRAGVTVTLHELEGKGLIKAERELITIRDRDGLVIAADGSYGVAESEYERLVMNA